MRFLPDYAKLLAVVIPLLHRCLRATAIVMAIQSDSAAGAACQPVPLGRLDGGATVEAIPVKGGGWGLQIGGAGMASAIQDKPVQLEFWSEAGRAAFAAASYDDWSEMNGGSVAKRLSTVRADVASTSRTIGTCKIRCCGWLAR